MKGKKTWIWCELALVLVIMLVFMFSGTTFTEAGDMRVADDVSSTYAPGFFLIGVVPAAVLRVFALIAPGINWWLVFSIITLAVPMFVLFDTIRVFVDERVSTVVMLLLGLALYKGILVEDICYTQNVALLAMAGFALIIRWAMGIIAGDEKTDNYKNGLWMAIFGGFLVLVAGSCRWKALVMCLPFAVMIVGCKILINLVFDRKIAGGKLFAKHKLELLIIVAFVGLVFGSAAIHKVYEKLDPYYAEYVAANELRRDIYDYPERYPNWDEHKEEYQALGIEKSWYSMVLNGYTCDMNNLSSEKLQVMKNLRGASSYTFGKSFQVLKGHYEMWIALAVIALLVILASLGSVSSFACAIVALLLNVASVLAFVCAFSMLGRNAWRVMVGIIIASSVSFLFMSSRKFLGLESGLKNCAECDDAKEKQQDSKKSNVFVRALTSPITVVVVTALVLFLILKDVAFTVPTSGVINEAGANLLDYMDAHDDIAYLQCDETYYYQTRGILAGKRADYCDNIFSSVGGVGLGRRKDMARLGINDMVIDMLNKPNIYTFYNDVWHGYIWDYYGRNVSVGIVDSFEGTDFIRYVAPKAAGGSVEGITVDDTIMTLQSSDSYNGYRVWTVECTLSGDIDLINGIAEYYVNVTNDATGDVYTYPLVYRDGQLSGQCFYYDNTWSFGDTRRTIVSVIDGECYNLVDVSAVPIFE